MKRFLTACLTFCFLVSASAAVQAASVRFTFDVVDADLRYDALYSPSGPVDTAAFIAAHHPLSGLAGQNFSSQLEFRQTTGNSGYPGVFGTLNCVTGQFCDHSTGFGNFGIGVVNSVFHEFDYLNGAFVETGPEGWDSFSSAYCSCDNRMHFSYQPDGSGLLILLSDFAVQGTAQFNGDQVWWEKPSAVFTLANLQATEIIPNPLPAPVFLLGAGLIPLALLRRRKNRV